MSEKDEIAALTKAQRRRIARYSCKWCDHPLHHAGCGAIYERCSPETRAKRRADCLNPTTPQPRRK